MKRSMAILLLSAIILTSYTAAPKTTSAASSSAQKVVSGHINSGVNLRDKPSTSGNIISSLKKDSDVVVLERSNDYFYKVQTSQGQIGYVSSAEKYISVSGSGTAPGGSGSGVGQAWTGLVIYGVNFRDQPSTSGKIVTLLKKGTSLTILEKTNSAFYKVKTENGKVGYVSSSDKYMTVSGGTQVPTPNPTPSESVNKQVELVIKAGMKYLGTPYEYGSDRNTTLTFDCSDFVRQAFKDALNLVLPADSRGQGTWVKNNSKAVYSTKDLKRGDLMFFMSYKGSSASAYAGVNKATERITHVGIYLGDGQILQTYSTKSGGVRTDKLDGAWVHRFLYGGSVVK
ncbi:hypothetical protein EJP82_18415 [Paenibacillus anaericanus]|uniref:Hydrolase Nlp/P60 n=1 Tax=Paenibacillus anaericanus TaxID=170367 RepID=A0A3S1DL97_9BACL|nr:SH3 domain-containing C40 family peptidase [Paenibacillus anaericanus]RUT43920.1 hypothetical protein EJP82_18415 [Paenibacillus anaericanus]